MHQDRDWAIKDMREGPGEDVGVWMDGGGILRLHCLGHEEDDPWGAADSTPSMAGNGMAGLWAGKFILVSQEAEGVGWWRSHYFLRDSPGLKRDGDQGVGVLLALG